MIKAGKLFIRWVKYSWGLKLSKRKRKKGKKNQKKKNLDLEKATDNLEIRKK